MTHLLTITKNCKNLNKGTHVVYIIAGKYKNKIRTYIGYTNNICRRLRQHNGEIKGGAKHTIRARPWKLIYYIYGFSNHKEALSFEWWLAHRGKKYKCQMQISLKLRYKDTIKILNKWEEKHGKYLWLCTESDNFDDVKDFPCHLEIFY